MLGFLEYLAIYSAACWAWCKLVPRKGPSARNRTDRP
jgi:hypothetical protein